MLRLEMSLYSPVLPQTMMTMKSTSPILPDCVLYLRDDGNIRISNRNPPPRPSTLNVAILGEGVIPCQWKGPISGTLLSFPLPLWLGFLLPGISCHQMSTRRILKLPGQRLDRTFYWRYVTEALELSTSMHEGCIMMRHKGSYDLVSYSFPWSSCGKILR
jgi:hypothetical protein